MTAKPKNYAIAMISLLQKSHIIIYHILC